MNLMKFNLKNSILRALLWPLLNRNKKFINYHKDQTCYIFGNGASLKNMDLSLFSDHPGIGLNLLCIHNDYKLLNIKYHVICEPFFLYPLIRNPYNKKIQYNFLGNLFKKSFKNNNNICLFTRNYGYYKRV